MSNVQGMAVSNYKADEKEAARNRKRLMALIKRPENKTCMDCPAQLSQNAWASISLGGFICFQCSGIHRNLGVHLTKVCMRAPAPPASLDGMTFPKSCVTPHMTGALPQSGLMERRLGEQHGEMGERTVCCLLGGTPAAEPADARRFECTKP
jgi:hypothetical protein